MNQQEPYSGWLINIVEQEKGGYRFHCWLPDEPNETIASHCRAGMSDRRTYSSVDQALEAAKQKINLETARLALEHCYRRRQEGDLTLDDYHFLVDFIAGVIQRYENSFQTAY